MLGWIKKIGGKDAAGVGGSTASSGNSGDANSSSRAAPGVLDPDPSHDQHRGQSRRTSFLDVGALMGRGKRRDDRGHAQGLSGTLSVLEAQRAEKISCVAFKLVREIQRILKEARENQVGSGVSSSPSARQQQKTKAGKATSAAASAAVATSAAGTVVSASGNESPAATKRNRWAGTGELLNLLNGSSPGGAGEAEDRVDNYSSVAEVEANMEDLVEQALRPESHGDLCGILLEASSGEGYHPEFVKLCVDAGLPSNLVHCLRIMRVIEFESAIHDSVNGGKEDGNKDNDDNDDAGGVAGEKIGNGDEAPPEAAAAEWESEISTATWSSEENTKAATVAMPLTDRATERIGHLLVTLCKDKSAGVGEQIKPHLPGLLSLAVSAYPPNGAHVQEMARSVVEALMGGCLNSSMVWLLHYNKAMLDVVGELRHLCGLDETPASKSPTRKNGRSFNSRAPSPVGRGNDARRRSPAHSRTPGGSGGDVGNEPPSTELVGKAAEARGLWLAALRATVCTVRCASHFVPPFVQDFESAGGYETVAYMVRQSSIERLPAMLEQVCLLVSALASSGVDASARKGSSSGDAHLEHSELTASNPIAFTIIQSLLAECTPPVEAVCLQGINGRVSTGTCDVNCLAGGQWLAEQGLDPEDAVVMVAERAVAMRLDRWGREHGFVTPTLAHIRSGTASSNGTDEEDGGGFGSFGDQGIHALEGRYSGGGGGGRGGSRSSVAAVETTEDVANADEFRLRLLEAVLGLYSNHPLNYEELESRFHALSFFLCALPYYENRELKGLALKTLEVICVSFKDVHPRDALHSTSTAFTVCLDHMMGLLSDPLCSPGVGRKVSLVMERTDDRSAEREVGHENGAALGGSDGGSGGGGEIVVDAGEVVAEEDYKVNAALDKALVLLEDADMMRRMLEKLLEFDEKKYTAMFQTTGILDQVLQPLLKRVLTLNVGNSPGAAALWRAMRHPGLVVEGGASSGAGGSSSGTYGSSYGGNSMPTKETGALALVSRATGLLCGTLALLLGYSPAICRQFRALRMHDTLYDVIRDFGPPSADAALLALERASSSEPSGVPEDMAFLIELVQGSKSRAERWRQAAALMGLRSILLCKHQAVKDVWRESCGFEAALAAISSLDAAFSTRPAAAAAPVSAHAHEDSGFAVDKEEAEKGAGAGETSPAAAAVRSHDTIGDKEGVDGGAAAADSKWDVVSQDEAGLMEAEHFRVIQAALLTLVASACAGPVAVMRGEQLVGYRANRRYLRREISYDSLTCCLVNSGVVASQRYAGPAVKLLFTMVTEMPCDNMLFKAGLEGGNESRAATCSGSGGGRGSGGRGSRFVGVGGSSSLSCQSASSGQAAPTVRNADAVMVILGVLPYVSEEIAWAALGALNEVVRAGGFAEAEALVAAGAARKVADVLAKALHAQRLSRDNSSSGGGLDTHRGGLLLTPKKRRSDAPPVAGSGGGGGSALPKALGTDNSSAAAALRNRVPELPARGTVAVLSAHLELTDRLQQRLVEFMILVASRHVTNTDLAPLIRSVSLPLVMDARGYVAPPTVWPSSLALTPAHHASSGKSIGNVPANGALWLPGWGTFLSSSAIVNNHVETPPSPAGKKTSSEAAMVRGADGAGRGVMEDEDERWRWLGVLTAMSARAEDSTPFLRLGGSPHTDMSGVCHEVSRAEHRGRSSSFSGNAGGGSSGGGGQATSPKSAKAASLWRAQQKALVEAVLEEGIRMVHVPGLEGSATASAGTGPESGGGAGGGGGTAASWPGPAGYSFVCWMRFNPPEPNSAATAGGGGLGPPSSINGGRGDAPYEFGAPEAMKAWGADAARAAALSAAVAAASVFPTATAIPMASAGIASDASGLLGADSSPGGEVVVEDSGDVRAVSKSPMLVSTATPDRSVNAVAEKAAADWMAAAGRLDTARVERRQSVDSAYSAFSGREAEEDETVVRPHLPGRQVLWVFAVASPDGRTFLQLFLDLDLLRFCLRGSAFKGEVRFDTPRHLVCGGARVWHHVVLTHARPKSRILGTRDKLSLWVDGELTDTVKVDGVSFTTAEGQPSAYMGCPHPQAFLDPTLGATVAPAWHLGPCALLTEVVELSPYMFALGPEYTGFWTSENPTDAVSSANAARALRHLQALGGEAGFAVLGGDVPHALALRSLRDLDKCFNVTERAFYWHRRDRASVTDTFHLLLAPEQVTFAYNTRHMERPGGPTPPLVAGAGPAFPVADTSSNHGHGRGGSAGDVSYDTADGSSRPSQVPSSAKRAATSASLVTGWLFNAAREVNPPSVGPGPVACAYGASIGVTPSSLPRALAGAGGPALLFPLLQRAQTEVALCAALRLIGRVVRGGGAASVAYMQTGGGYLVLAALLRSRQTLLGSETARVCFEMAVDRAYGGGVVGRSSRNVDGDGDDGGEQRSGASKDGSSGGDEGGYGKGDKDQYRPWGGGGGGRSVTAAEKAEELKKATAWGWEKDVTFARREDVAGFFDGGGAAAGDGGRHTERPAGGKENVCPFVLLTDPYALKYLVMNHQVWGLGNRALMVTVLQLMHSLVSPHNVKPYCRFNARVLHRVGLFRWGLHFLLEASEPLPAPVTTAAAAKAAASSSASVTSAESAAGAALSPLSSSDSAGDTEKSCDHLVAIAGFGGVKRPAAAVAAAGLDTRDGFMVSCTLLLQRVLATCTIQRDFDRVIGATLSTLADGGAAGSREARCAGTDPDFAAVEEVLEKAKLLGDEGSAGNKVLSGQAMVRLYLLRMLLEIVTLPVTAASKGEFPAAEGVYVGGVGSPCARRAQAAVEVASLGGRVRESGTESSSIMMGVSQLERWVDGIPPVVDVGADGAGLPSPLYAGRSRLFRTVCMRALRPDWFISLLETCREEAGVSWTFRLLAAMLQGSEEFASSFQVTEGFRAMATCLPYHSASLPILLTVLALALGVPVAALPPTAEGMSVSRILSLLRRNAGTATGPANMGTRSSGRSSGGGVDEQPQPFVRMCVAKILLPAMRSNAALLRRAEAAGVVTRVGTAAAAATAGGEGRSSTARGGGGGGGGVGAPELSEWKRAKRASEVVSAAFWEALVNDPSFRLTCRSPEVVGALVDVLCGTWDEPEVGVGGNKVRSGGGGDGEKMEGDQIAATATEEASSHPPAELLRLVIAEIVSSGGGTIFPSLVHLFNAGAAVMGPILPAPPSPTNPMDTLPASFTRDLSPLGREKGAPTGVFQRAMLRHLEACCRDVMVLSATADSSRRSPQQRSSASGNAALDRALSSLAAVAAAVAEAAAEGLLPGVETGHLAVGFLSSLLRQVSLVSTARSSGVVDGVKATALGAYHVVTVVALRRAVQRASGRGARRGTMDSNEASRRSGGAEGRRRLVLDDEGNDLLEECLLMMAHNFDALLGEERRSSSSLTGASVGGGFSSGNVSVPRTPPHKMSLSPKLLSPQSSAGMKAVDANGQDSDDNAAMGKPALAPLDLGSTMLNAVEEAPLTTCLFAETPAAVPRWSSRFDFPGEAATPGMGADPSRLATTFTVLELGGIGNDGGVSGGGGGGGGSGPLRVPLINTGPTANSSTGGRSPTASTSKSLWESAAAGAAGLVAAADRGNRGASSAIGGGAGGGGDGGVNGLRESLVYRLRGSSGRAFVAGFVAELRELLLSDNDSVRKLTTRLTGALLARRRGAVQELLGEELLSTGFSMLEHPLGGEASLDPVSEDETLAEETRSQAFALWLTGARQEASLTEGFYRAADRAYALIPQVSSEDGLMAALTRAELLASGTGGSGGSSALSRLGSGVGGALGALAAAAPNRKTITVDRAIQRADMIARTYERVATSHGRWVWSGADDLAWSSRAWRLKLASLCGQASLWEGGLFGRLMRSPEAIAASRPGPDGSGGGLDEERFKLDMDEGPERTRLRLCPNHAFYDTYEVLAPAQFSSTPALLKADETSTSQERMFSTEAEAGTDGATADTTIAAVAAVAAVVTPQITDAAGEPNDDELPDTDSEANEDTEAASADGEAGAVVSEEVAAAAAALEALSSGESSTMPDMGPTVEGGSVAEIAALVKSMSQTVGVGKGKTGIRGALTSVFDLDDTDTSALLELEELRLDEAPEGTEEGSPSVPGGVKGGAVRAVSSESSTSLLPAISETAKHQAVAADGDGASREASEHRFSLAASELAEEEEEEDDEDDDGVSVTTESQLGLDDDRRSVMSMELRDRDGDPSQGAAGVGGGDADTTPGRNRGRTRRRQGLPGRHDQRVAGDASLSPSKDVRRPPVVSRGTSPGAAIPERIDGAESGAGPKSPRRLPRKTPGAAALAVAGTTAALAKASGPGATARGEGWSDRELLLGLLQPEDSPVIAVHDVSRSIGGVEVKRGLLLVCRGAMYFVAGFGRGPPRRPSVGSVGGGSSSGRAIPSAKNVANNSKDPLHSVRRLEEWELGGGAGGVGGGDEDGEAGAGVKIQVTLRRKSAPDIAGGASNSPRDAGKGGGSRSLTTEQAGGTRGEKGKGEQEEDEIVALGRVAVQRIVLDQVHAVYKRRYQLRDVGLEIFDILGRSVLVSFETQEQQEDVLTYLLARGLPASIFAHGKSKLRLAVGSSHAQARAAYKKFMQAERASWTKKWQLGRCTNFEYLMAINTLAGRSFNDLTQYPVFPWVLCDYVSEELDLDNPGIYRDLSKPMGAIGEMRARQFRERYVAVIEAAEETGRDPDPPPFHYGTHYSCAGYILHYLLRLEPFTRLALGLQGGRFDKPDRLFRDIRSSWESASSENLQDVRELTPEFYTVPEFLVNSNRFDLGVTQKGQAVNHVVLPPWAKGDPREFIRLHRKALESPHVSRNLHQWVGLIFGCKQRGPEAVAAQNVFVHLTYEGEVDIDSIQDPLLRDAALAQIHNFGQTPSLVLKKPHPAREVPPVVRISVADGSRSADPSAVEWHASLTPPLCIVGAPDAVALKPVALTSVGGAWQATSGGGVGDARIIRDKIMGVGQGAILYSRSPDKYLRFGGPSNGLSFFQAPSVASSSSKSSTDRLLSSHAALHQAPVTALACTEDGLLLLTGAADGTCRLWGVVNLQHTGGQVVKTLDLAATLGWHAGPVTCACMCMGSGTAVTGGAGGKVLVWDIRRKSFMRELLGHHNVITSVGINRANGNVVTLAGTELRVWTVNGRLLASCAITALRRGATPTCATPTDCPDWQDGVVAATGHDNGDVLLWGIQWNPPPARGGGSRSGDRSDRFPSSEGNRSGQVRQLKLLRVLSGAHQRPITFVRVCEGGRELLVGDIRGEISRWQCIRLDQMSTEELNQLV